MALNPPTPTAARPGSLSVAPGELIEAVTETAHQYQQVGKPPRNAVTAALTDHAEQQPDTHADNLYLVAYIHHHFGVDEEELIHASGSRHATTWTDVTTGLARSALTQVVDHILTGEIRPTAITPEATLTTPEDGLRFRIPFDHVVTWGSHDHRIKRRHYRDLPRGLPLTPREVEAFLENALTPATAAKSDAYHDLHDVMDRIAPALRETGPAVAGSLLDAYHELYGLTGENAIESEQLAAAGRDGWQPLIHTGVLWHATHAALNGHSDQAVADDLHRQDR